MQEEAADELHDLKSESSGSLAVGFAVANEDRAVMDTQDARVGDGDFEDVGGQVFESGLTGAHGLRVDVPIGLPDFGGDLIEEFGLLHEIAELGSKDFRQSLYGKKEIDLGGVPGAIG